jgi:hypothetical protein
MNLRGRLENVSQGPKPDYLCASCGPAEAVPFLQNHLRCSICGPTQATPAAKTGRWGPRQVVPFLQNHLCDRFRVRERTALGKADGVRESERRCGRQSGPFVSGSVPERAGLN